jgi:hypothetical protein
VQAIRSSAEPVSAAQMEVQMRSIVLSVHERLKNLETFRGAIKADSTSAALITMRHLDKVVKEGKEVLTAMGDRKIFQIELADFNAAVKDLEEILSTLREEDFEAMGVTDVRQAQQLDFSAFATIPQISTSVPQVVFTIGPGWNLRSGENIVDIGLSTNLLGALGGAAFDLLGADPLKQYFQNNISAGPAIQAIGPTERITAQLGLGLGEINLGPVKIWPVMNIEQTDSSDVRIPRDILRRQTTEETWSSPIFSVGLIHRKHFELLKQGKAVPIFSIGIRLPYYFPGNTFETIASLFSVDELSKLEKRGGVELLLGFSIPLRKVEAPQENN